MGTEVRDVMTADVVSVEERAGFKEIVEVMRRHGVRALPVLDSAGQVRGVVSTSDLLFKVTGPAADGGRLRPGGRRARRKAEAVTAAGLMTAPPITVSPMTAVEDAARMMRRHDVNQLPVIDVLSGRLVGVVSRSDLLRVYTRRDADIRRAIFAEAVAEGMGLDRRRLGILVEKGRVTLQGTVERRSQIVPLLRAVRRVEGVVSVRSLLQYDTDDLSTIASL